MNRQQTFKLFTLKEVTFDKAIPANRYNRIEPGHGDGELGGRHHADNTEEGELVEFEAPLFERVLSLLDNVKNEQSQKRTKFAMTLKRHKLGLSVACGEYERASGLSTWTHTNLGTIMWA